MKNTKRFAFTVLFFVFIFSCYGQSSDKVAIQANTGSGIFKLIYKSTKPPGTVKVSITDSKGETVFAETLNKVGSFTRPYNFNDQSPGDFKMIVEDKEGKTEKKISYTVKKVESVIDVSKIANATNKYLLSIENKDYDQIKVKIQDQDKNIMHEETITVNGKFAVVYSLDKFKKVPSFEITGSSGASKTFNFQ